MRRARLRRGLPRRRLPRPPHPPPQLAVKGSPAAKSYAIELAGGPDAVAASHIDAAAAVGDPWALALWLELAPLLAVALGNALAVLNSERLVLGGGVLVRCPTLVDLVVTTLHLGGAAAAVCRAPIDRLLAELGDDAGLKAGVRPRCAAAGT